MSSVTRTLDLLSYFSTDRPEIGLSKLCRLAKRDKATTYRHLQALEDVGFVEQNPSTKHYRLGPALLQLAQTREMTVPRKLGAMDALRKLSDATGETTHVSVLSGTILYALAACESPKHSTRVIIDIQTFPLHATASGICALAFGPDELIKSAAADLRRFTGNTATTTDALMSVIQGARKCGFGLSAGSFETDTHSLSAPVFDQAGHFAGAVSVACVATRFSTELEAIIKSNLVIASREITRNWGGTVPEYLEQIWAETLLPSDALESAS